VIVFVSHSHRSVRQNSPPTPFLRSSPRLSNFDTLEETPTSRYSPCSSSPLASNSPMHDTTKPNPVSSRLVSSPFDTFPGCPYVYVQSTTTNPLLNVSFPPIFIISYPSSYGLTTIHRIQPETPIFFRECLQRVHNSWPVLRVQVEAESLLNRVRHPPNARL
jgi:hypothetical protein